MVSALAIAGLLLIIDRYSLGWPGGDERWQRSIVQSVLAGAQLALLGLALMSVLHARWRRASNAVCGEAVVFVSSNLAFVARDGWGRVMADYAPSGSLLILFAGAVLLRALLIVGVVGTAREGDWRRASERSQTDE